LGGGGEVEFAACTIRSSYSQPVELQDALEMGDPFAP
jgi:hypothetical protein